MKKYIFYNKKDKKKEPLMIMEALDMIDAVEKFAQIKKLGIGEFTKLFEIEIKKD